MYKPIKHINEDEDDQDIVIEICRNIQDIVEYWIQQHQIDGVQDMYDPKNSFIMDMRDYSSWMSESKVLGTRVIRVEIFLQ